ncbi:MAG TPA: FlgD immunoglobulin-like domain containing protein, partial [bacterium]|nr:FlgD immunoglobulin-like domain containing protein [bacterium]
EYSGFVVEFDAKEAGVGMDEAEPVFEATFWGDCAPATATDAPAVAAASSGGPAITVRPSVTRSGAEILLAQPARAAAAIALVDVSGRLVRRLDVAAGASAVRWDGGAADGRRVSSGVYFLRLTGQGAGGSARIVVVR